MRFVRMTVLTVCVFVTAVYVGSSSATPPPQPNLIQNSTFAIAGKSFNDAEVGPGSGFAIAHWTPGPKGVFDVYMTAALMPNGINQAVSLTGEGGPSWITQTIATVPGTSYLLSWYATGEPGGTPVVKTMHVLWNNRDIATTTYDTTGQTVNTLKWVAQKKVVTATGTTSTVQFASATPSTTADSVFVTDVMLAAIADLFLPSTASVTPTGTITAIVHGGTGTPLTAKGVTVQVTAPVKSASYAPATTQVIASAPVVNGQAVLHLKLPASEKGKTLAATVTLTGPDYLTVTKRLTIKVK